MIAKGEDYNKLKKSFVIFICNEDPFGQGRHFYSFENRCLQDYALGLNDETTKLFLNTSGTINDVDDEMLDFLNYVKSSTEQVAKQSKSSFVKALHQKVEYVKNDKRFEVEWMTLLERDREKLQEGIERGKEEMVKELLKEGLLSKEQIAKVAKLPLEKIDEIEQHNVACH